MGDSLDPLYALAPAALALAALATATILALLRRDARIHIQLWRLLEVKIEPIRSEEDTEGRQESPA
ncbi:hypothetical protein [Pyrodictium delaneyi]|uniref:Uncharacterized protein n=1 Tax=Pyrodictium delaneyi TaxID=1273541 RepID=A0A211YRG8_9CREN|nr:hypothetical protein [Pyrodictium delaneyi]OWJ55600.1 hypothetical protein Pdsh_02090 [Pyrodictium delaneyi]